MVRLWTQVSVSEQINLLAFPCNQFGEQEPGSNQEIEDFAKGYGVDFTLMDKIDVNGPNTSIVYKWIKAQASVGHITWNFATYFVVSPEGVVTAHSGVEPMELRDFALGMVDWQEL
jgi:glutathione peroxidase-family protein